MAENKLDFLKEFNIEEINTQSTTMNVAAYFWERDRALAAKIFYKTMRDTDDLVDDRKSTGIKISDEEKSDLITKINNWIGMINGTIPCDSERKQLVETINKFKIPVKPWQEFSKAMIYDINNEGFATYPIFLEYCEGAAIAPASIFMHLCGLRKENGEYLEPSFDTTEIARPIALFSYMVHIIRDFQEDQINHLNYFAEDLVAENGLELATLKGIASGNEIPQGFRNLMKKYYGFAEHYKHEARQALDEVSSHLKPQYVLSLEIVFSLYNQIFERIDVLNGQFTTSELIPSPEEIRETIVTTISSFESKFSS
ncbi:MAG: squalene/phytoene synthase family protein [Candidatus Thorarchaeota archaeon]